MVTLTNTTRSTRLLKEVQTNLELLNAGLSAGLSGLDMKDAVRAATTADGTFATAYADSQAIDGVTLATGDRILLKDQTAADENGIYTVNASGAPTRSTDADVSAEVTQGLTTIVMEGTVNVSRGYSLTTAPAVIDTNDWVFTLIFDGSPAASSVVNVATGGIVATDVQAAIDELDTEKARLDGNNYSAGRMTFDGETVTISTVDVPVAIGTSTVVGDNNGFTVGTDGTLTATFTGTKTCHLRARVTMVSAATTLNDASLDILVDGVSVFSSAERDIDSDGNGAQIFEVDHYLDVVAAEVVTLAVTNGTDAENITVSAYVDRVDTAPSSGWMTINTA